MFFSIKGAGWGGSNPRHGKSSFLSAIEFSRYAKCPQNLIFRKQLKVPKIAIFLNLWDIFKKKGFSVD